MALIKEWLTEHYRCGCVDDWQERLRVRFVPIENGPGFKLAGDQNHIVLRPGESMTLGPDGWKKDETNRT